jgi:hypothetical protein
VKANQGMRQPQYGRIQSQLRLTRATMICRHSDLWRLASGGKWICAVCHPPLAFREDQIERTTSA